jgi:hypothetical protein
VGCPRWSSTTWTGPGLRALPIIAWAKLPPCAPYSQAVRST